MLSSKVLPKLSTSPLALDFDAFKYEPLQAAVQTAVESPIKTFFCTLIQIVAAWFLLDVYLDRKTIPGFPIVGEQKWDFRRQKARLRYLNEGDKVVKEGMEQVSASIMRTTCFGNYLLNHLLSMEIKYSKSLDIPHHTSWFPSST
jgi:hypothetical protein